MPTTTHPAEALVFECTNPMCRHTLKVRQPAVAGVYPVKCPFCGTVKKVRFKGINHYDAASRPNQENHMPQPSPQPATARVAPLIVGELSKFPCPHCGQMLGAKPAKEGRMEFSCPRCKGKVVADAHAHTRMLDYDPVVDAPGHSMLGGSLTLLRRGWLNKKFHLPIGRHTIGRADDNEPSDISIAGDTAMSRRSVTIDVSPSLQGLMFRLTVMHATNPVIHNGVPLRQGESVSLNFGDTLQLGRTLFRFDKSRD